jgi:monoamine oxidase
VRRPDFQEHPLDNSSPQAVVTRRSFLEQMALVGGTGLLLAGMEAFGYGIASAAEAPPAMTGGAGKTVIILGAGVAGMSAAYELNKAGYKVQVIEARSFAGGRCQTARAGFSLTELGGATQTCDFDPGLYINHGPWRLPYHHRSVLHYTKLFKVPLEVMVNDNDRSFLFFDKGTGPLAGKKVRKGEIAADIRGSAAEMLAKVVRKGGLDDPMTAEDRELLVQYLIREGRLSRDSLAYTGTDGRGFITPPGAGLEAGTPSKPFAVTDILHSRTWQVLASVAEFEQQRTMFQPVGGMDAIAKAFAKAIGPMIKYSTVVDKIQQDANGVTISATAGGKPVVIKGDYCLCTIPLSVLKSIDLGVSDTFKAAIAAPSYAPVGKIGLQMKRRFWEEDEFIYGGHVHTDNPDIGSITLPSTGWQSNKGVLLGYYQFGANAAKISALSPAARATFATDFGKKIFPTYQSDMEKHFSVAWHRVQYNLGGWAGWSAEARAKSYPTLLEPDGRIYLAGEHLSHLGGWQAGGIESAWQQIAKIHARVMAA